MTQSHWKVCKSERGVVIQGFLKEKVFLLFLQTSWGGGGFSPLALERGGAFAPPAPKPVVVVVAFSSFISEIHISAWYYSDSHLSFFHTSYMYFYIHHTHIFINIHNWVCTSGLNLAHRSQRVQGTITILKNQKEKNVKMNLINIFSGSSGWNRQHHGQTIHPTEKFKILLVMTWA